MIPQKLMEGPLMWAVFTLTLIAILCAGIWDLASDQTEQRVKSEQSTREHIEYAEDRIDQKCLMLEPMLLRDCIHKEIESARDHGRANQDLNAQQQMAFFTKIMAWTTAAGLALGIISIAVIYSTLTEMGRTNQIMRDEQRPWVALDRELACEFFDNGHGGLISWNYELENKGLGLAHDIKVDWEIVKRHHFQHMKPQLHDYLAEIVRKGRSQQMVVLFPKERTENHKFRYGGSTRYREDKFTGDPNFFGEGTHFMLMVCVTYRLASHSEKFGFDVRMFGIERAASFIGPWGHTILEYSNARLIG